MVALLSKRVKRQWNWKFRAESMARLFFIQLLSVHGGFQGYLYQFRKIQFPDWAFWNGVVDDADQTFLLAEGEMGPVSNFT